MHRCLCWSRPAEPQSASHLHRQSLTPSHPAWALRWQQPWHLSQQTQQGLPSDLASQLLNASTQAQAVATNLANAGSGSFTSSLPEQCAPGRSLPLRLAAAAEHHLGSHLDLLDSRS